MITILIGKSGAGKDTTQNLLTGEYGFERVVTCTSRPPRVGEVEGKDYFFFTQEGFEKALQENRFIESVSHKVTQDGKPAVRYYGSIKQELDPNKDNCIILDMQGAMKFVDYYGRQNCFVVNYTLDEAIRKDRAKARGSFSESEWQERCERDNRLFEGAEQFANFNLSVDSNSPEYVARETVKALDAYKMICREMKPENADRKITVSTQLSNTAFWEQPEFVFVADVEGIGKYKFETPAATISLSPAPRAVLVEEAADNEKGLFYGVNAASHNLIMHDRKTSEQPNGFVLGTSGSGRGFTLDASEEVAEGVDEEELDAPDTSYNVDLD